MVVVERDEAFAGAKAVVELGPVFGLGVRLDGRGGCVEGVCEAEGAVLGLLVRGAEVGFLEGGLEVFGVERGVGGCVGLLCAVGGGWARVVG